MGHVINVIQEFLVVIVDLVFVKDQKMTPTSKRRKGAHLQNLVRDKVLKAFPHLKPNDIVTAKNGQNGPDLLLSKVARKLVGFNFECKFQQRLSTIYTWKKQSDISAKGKLIGTVVMKMNSRKPLVVLDLDDFIKLIKE